MENEEKRDCIGKENIYSTKTLRKQLFYKT